MAQSLPDEVTTASPAGPAEEPTLRGPSRRTPRVDLAGDESAGASTMRQPPDPDPQPLTLAREIVALADDKGAADILLMDIRKLSIIADYFVICSGENERQIRAISRGIQDGVDERWGLDPIHRPGSEQEEAGWVVLDYSSVIVHIFSPQMRDYYRLERLWSEAATLLRMQ